MQENHNTSREGRLQPPSKPTLIYNEGVDTPFGIRDIQLYWGSLHSIMSQNSTAIVSSTIFNSRGLVPEGAAWRGIKELLDLDEEANFQLGLTAAKNSLIWPLSDELAENLNRKNEEKRPFISVLHTVPSPHPQTPQQIICAHTFPARGYSSDDDTHLLMKALLSQLILSATSDNLEDDREPSKEVVLSTLLGTQGAEPGILLKSIISQLRKWSQHLPHVHRYKVAYWDKGFQKEFEAKPELIRDGLLKELGEVPARERPEYISEWANEITKLLHKLIAQPGESESLKGEYRELLLVLSRPDWSIRELGSSAGRLTEGLVMGLELRFFGKNSGSFCSAIDTITGTGETKRPRLNGLKLSAWFNSYLHTLRILRNASAHPQKGESLDTETFPRILEEGDVWILLGSLHRVLQLHLKLLNKLRSESGA